jgi:crotonobetainyl-CoA:carnitine CoA-transferase CaiB-like acyl-CoA transferase
MNSPGTDALHELRVVEIGEDVACAYTTKLLADLGADVVKIETPRGDALRRYGPFPGDRPDPEASGMFRYLHANKRSIVLDLATPEGARHALEIAAGADLLVESNPPGRLEGLSLGPDDLRRANPRIAVVRISPFGQTGPYRDLDTTDLVTQAAGGWVSSHGLPSAKPVCVGGRIPEYLTGTFAAAAALTAVRAAGDRGEAVVVDVCEMECLVGTLPYPMLWAETLLKLGMPPPQKRRTPIPGALRCADGWVGVNALTAQNWADCCNLFEVPEFTGVQNDIASGRPDAADFFARIQPWLDQHTVEEVVALGQAFRIPTISVGNGETLTRLPQLVERPFFTTDPELGFLQPSFPYRLSRTPARARRPAPRLGEHGDEIRRAPWPPRASSGAAASPQAKAASTERSDFPFRGLRVLDLGTFWAGPYVGMYLATLGADVIKIESVQRPDGYRFTQTFAQLGEDYYEHSTTYQSSNLGKRNLTLDLSRPEGRDLLRRLVATADVVLENFSPRVMEGFDLDYAQLREIKPDVIMIRMPGFGLAGPWRNYVGWALVIEQVTGMSWITGHPDGPPLGPGGFIDCAVSMHAGVALQAALRHRERTGEGQLIELAQIETGACLTAEQVIDFSMNGASRNPGTIAIARWRRRSLPVPRRSGVALSIRDDADWARLVVLLGAPDWARQPDLATAPGGAPATARSTSTSPRGPASATPTRSSASSALGAFRPRAASSRPGCTASRTSRRAATTRRSSIRARASAGTRSGRSASPSGRSGTTADRRPRSASTTTRSWAASSVFRGRSSPTSAHRR